MQYISTRNKNVHVTGETAIASGICPSGGLFVPKTFPKVSLADLKKLSRMDYYERAAYILHLFLPDFDFNELKAYCDKVYSHRFGLDPTPIIGIRDTFVLELWHGPTLAFKDFALQMLPYLLAKSKKALGDERESLVLTATSGDTGAAAIEGFKDVDGVRLAVFYPHEGVSKLQALQMTTANSPNVSVFSIKGNFDDAQSAVKKVFKDEDFISELKAGHGFN